MSSHPNESWMTEAERLAWWMLGRAARAVFALPPVHPSEHAESVRDFHDLQCRLLARAAYSLDQRDPGRPAPAERCIHHYIVVPTGLRCLKCDATIETSSDAARARGTNA